MFSGTTQPIVSDSTQRHGGEPNWTDLIDRIRACDSDAVAELYAKFCKGLRYFLLRQLGSQDAEDRVHDVIIAVIKAIQSGSVRESEKLPGFVKTVAHRSCARSIASLVKDRQREGDLDEKTANARDCQIDPEARVLIQERVGIARQAFFQLSVRDMEVLRRFYLEEQLPGRICRDMNLTDTQFRSIKSRAKGRFGEIGRKRVSAKTCLLQSLQPRVA